MRLGILLSLLLCVACDDAALGTTSGSGGSTEGGGGGAGGGTTTPATLASWTEGPPLAQARDHHHAFVVETDAGAFLYAAGGVENNATLFDSVEVAALAPDGSIGAWSAGTALPQVTAGAGVAVVGRVVLIAGGYRMVGAQPRLSRATDVSVVDAGGALGAWTAGPEMSLTRFHGAMATRGADVFVVGGLTGNNTVNTERVERATVAPDGTVSTWVQMTPLPRPLSHHAVAVHGDAIYLTGGLEGDPNNANDYEVFAHVLRAPIDEQGVLGPWVEVGAMPFTLNTHASFVHGDHLYVVGGIADDHHNTEAVYRAPIATDGTVGPWEAQAALPTPRAHAHQTPVWGDFVFAMGGALNHVSTPRTFVGRFE